MLIVRDQRDRLAGKAHQGLAGLVPGARCQERTGRYKEGAQDPASWEGQSSMLYLTKLTTTYLRSQWRKQCFRN